MTTLVRTPADFRRACEDARRRSSRVGLVPTMGALHRGHFSLIDEAQERADFVAVTVFVNPLQFAPEEDLDRYPRTLEQDLKACEERDVQVVFAPEAEAMYPSGFQSSVVVKALAEPLEGRHRPGHFDGVTTVVSKLFNLAGPSVACFGRKDYQQWKVVERMVRDLDMPIEVIGCAIVRESDGLALSSRNRYLSADERQRALGIVKGLRRAYDAWTKGERKPEAIRRLVEEPVRAGFDRVDYVAAVDPDTLRPTEGQPEKLLIAAAAHLGHTRLIDNIVLGNALSPAKRP